VNESRTNESYLRTLYSCPILGIALLRENLVHCSVFLCIIFYSLCLLLSLLLIILSAWFLTELMMQKRRSLSKLFCLCWTFAHDVNSFIVSFLHCNVCQPLTNNLKMPAISTSSNVCYEHFVFLTSCSWFAKNDLHCCSVSQWA